MTIRLPDELESYVKKLVDQGRFANAEEALAEAIRLLQQKEHAAGAREPLSQGSPEPAWQLVLSIMKDTPNSEFERIPLDSSEQLDHYVYGTAKRMTS